MRILAVPAAALMALAPAGHLAAGSGPRFNFRVPTLSGGTITQEDFKGKLVVVDVWATWCGPCRMVIPHLVRLQDKFKAQGVAVVGLNADLEDLGPGTDLEPIRSFARSYGMNYPIGLMTPETYREVARVMGFDLDRGMSIPTTIIIGRNGRVLQRYPGYFPGQEREIDGILVSILEAEAAQKDKSP
ncbi:MAG TPA: TlpA disulfide reductase family protein [Candidatus Polarisedimenticolia bacterium]|nr:TlpA disulfide reductase family protein [Candidatus Polarisedimenticolia bacterium]